MSKHIITDFKDLRDAIEEVRKSQPAQTRYEIQAEKMGYMQEAEAKPEDDKKDGFAKRDNHAGEEEIIKAYKSLGDKALAGSVEYRRKLLQKELAKMGYETYSKYAFDSIFKFEGNIQEIQLDKNMLMRDFPNVWATKDSKLYRILNTQIITYGFTTLLKSYKKDRKKFVDSLKKLAKSPAAQKRAGFGAKDMQYINKPKRGQSFHENVDVDLDEGKMSDLLIDIQQGATAKELARDFKIPLSVAKNFLKDYYGSKKGSRKESVKEAFNYSPKDFEAQVKAYKYKNGVKFSQVMKDFEDDWDSAFGNRGFDHDNVVDGLKKALKKARIRFKEDVDERFNQKTPAGKKLKDFEVFLDEKDIDKAIKIISKELKKDRVRFNSKMKNLRSAPSGMDVMINAVDEEDRWRLMVMGQERSKNFKEIDLTSSFQQIQKLSSAQFKGMWAEGKYLKYSDLLLKKSRLIDKEGPNSPTVKAINKEIGKEMKKLGISEENLQEGTWAVPDSYKKLYNLQVGFLEVKKAATKANAKKMAKDLYNLFGDDELFDDLYRVEKGDDTETKDLRDILKKHLENWGIRIKPQGARYQITHAPQKWLDNLSDPDVDETAKRRKQGNIKKSGLGARKKFDMSMMSKEEKLKEAKQSPFKLKSQAYPRAIAINTDGFGKRHATVQDIIDACDSFGMITDKELQVEQIQKQLGKEGFITYKASELQDVFEDRETQRMIYALESLTEEQKPVEYYRDEIEDAYIMSEEIEFVKPDGQKTAGKILKICENTFNVKDKYTGKSFTYKYIKEEGVNKVKTFREITTITEGRFSKKLIRMAGGIAFDKRYVGGNMTGAVKAIEKLKKGLSDDPQVKDMLRLANESFNNEFYNSMSEDEKSEYQAFFQKALKKFGVSSPAELDDAKKKEFFDYVDKNWTGKKEEKESVSKKEEIPSETKIDGRRKNFREKMRKLGYIKGR